MLDRTTLIDFVRESNGIEGIFRKPTEAEVLAHAALITATSLGKIDDGIVEFVKVIQPNAKFRDLQSVPGVRVGSHIAPPSGPAIRTMLNDILADMESGKDPHWMHWRYETLHPFTDGNGRSGRALWLWQMVHQHGYDGSLRFLQKWYYQSLSRKDAE